MKGDKRNQKANKLLSKEGLLDSRVGQRIRDENTTTYIVVQVLKVKNNPHNTRWSMIKSRVEKALKREFGEDIVW